MLWLADYAYGYLFMTHRLDLVEFTPLPSGSGVQMLWRNPPGFHANSGEYVKVQLPWLLEGGSEWHPFSTYLNEETEEGLDKVTHMGGVGREVNSSTTAFLLIECQNEFASKGGKLHDGVKDVMKSTNMLANIVELAACARSTGAHVFHLPVVLNENGLDKPNKTLGIFRACQHDSKRFAKGAWDAEIVDCLKPSENDVVIQNIKGVDSFIGTDLQEQLERRGIETIILGGFLTNYGVESTMRSGYEKGFNVITLADGTACNSLAEQESSIASTYKMFSTTMDCAEAAEVLCATTPKGFLDDQKFSIPHTDEEALYLTDLRGSVIESGAVAALDLRHFIFKFLTRQQAEMEKKSFIMKEAREEIRSQYITTQIFMVPAGDWTKQVYEEVTNDQQLRHCWVKGPFVSPYSVVSNFSNLVLIASGIGITPALGVMGQYKGTSRFKTLIWSTRCPKMLKFFVPLIKQDATIAIIYYTGKEALSGADVKAVLSGTDNIFIQQSRPESLTDTVSTIITSTESITGGTLHSKHRVQDVPSSIRKQWCILYCGGSTSIKDMLKDYSKKVKVKFEYELFDW